MVLLKLGLKQNCPWAAYILLWHLFIAHSNLSSSSVHYFCCKYGCRPKTSPAM